jgi:hypothetical protein
MTRERRATLCHSRATLCHSRAGGNPNNHSLPLVSSSNPSPKQQPPGIAMQFQAVAGNSGAIGFETQELHSLHEPYGVYKQIAVLSIYLSSSGKYIQVSSK